MTESISLERKALGGLLKYNNLISEISGKDLFNNDIHKNICSIILSLYNNKQPIDKLSISQKLISIGIRNKDGIEIEDYVDTLDFTQVGIDGVRETFKHLEDLKIKRHIQSCVNRMSKLCIDENKKSSDIIAEIFQLSNDMKDSVNIATPTELKNLLTVNRNTLCQLYVDNNFYDIKENSLSSFICKNEKFHQTRNKILFELVSNKVPILVMSPLSSSDFAMSLTFESKIIENTFIYYCIQDLSFEKVSLLIHKYLSTNTIPLIVWIDKEHSNYKEIKRICKQKKCSILLISMNDKFNDSSCLYSDVHAYIQ
jgi:hypothetical protein